MPYWWENTEEERDIANVFGPNYKPTPSTSDKMVIWPPKCNILRTILTEQFHNDDPSLYISLNPCDLDPLPFPKGGWSVTEALAAVSDHNCEEYTLSDAIPSGLLDTVKDCMSNLKVWLTKWKDTRESLGDKISEDDKKRWTATMKFTEEEDEDKIRRDIEQFDYNTINPKCTVEGIDKLVAIYRSLYILGFGEDAVGYKNLYADFEDEGTGPIDLKIIIERIEYDIIKYMYAVIVINYQNKYETTNDMCRELLKFHTYQNEKHKEELCVFKKDVNAIMKELVKLTQQTDTPIASEPELVGSVSEDTKVFTPDEFDYMIDIDFGKIENPNTDDVKKFRERVLENFDECTKDLDKNLERGKYRNLTNIGFNQNTKFPQLLLKYCFSPPFDNGYEELIVKIDMVLYYKEQCKKKDKICRHKRVRETYPDGEKIFPEIHQTIIPNTNALQSTMWQCEREIIRKIPDITKDALRIMKIISSLFFFPSRQDMNRYLPSSYDIKNALFYALDNCPEIVAPQRGQLYKTQEPQKKEPPKVDVESVTPKDDLPNCDECRLIEIIRIANGIMEKMDFLTFARIIKPFFKTDGKVFHVLNSWHNITYAYIKILLNNVKPCEQHGSL